MLAAPDADVYPLSHRGALRTHSHPSTPVKAFNAPSNSPAISKSHIISPTTPLILDLLHTPESIPSRSRARNSGSKNVLEVGFWWWSISHWCVFEDVEAVFHFLLCFVEEGVCPLPLTPMATTSNLPVVLKSMILSPAARP